VYTVEDKGIEDVKMKIPKEAIVSNSDIIKNYKTQRQRAEIMGKLYVFKNNQPDAVLFSMTEFERVAELLELIDHMDDVEIVNILMLIKEHKKEILLALKDD
jgi:hypothetical protein